LYRNSNGRNSKKFGILKDKSFFGPSHSFIIVQKITKKIIEETIQAYAEEYDEYWLKLYYFASKIDISVFDKLEAKYQQHLKELD